MRAYEKYKNKCFSILGDSLSTLAGYNPEGNAVFYDHVNCRAAGIRGITDTWWGYVLSALGAQLLVNDAFSGSTVCHDPRYEIESYGCSDLRTGRLGEGTRTPDVVMILLGFNDRGHWFPITETAQRPGDDSFLFAYRTMLSKLRKNYPEAEIICLTLPCPVGYNERRDPYCAAIAKAAAEADCRLLDIHDPANTYQTIDGLHASAAGMRTIGDAVLIALEASLTETE